MVYIDPKDQPHNPDWPHLYKLAWEERRGLRLDRCKLDGRLAEYDTFLTVFEKLQSIPGASSGQSMTMTATPAICLCMNGVPNQRECRIHFPLTFAGQTGLNDL